MIASQSVSAFSWLMVCACFTCCEMLKDFSAHVGHQQLQEFGGSWAQGWEESDTSKNHPFLPGPCILPAETSP